MPTHIVSRRASQRGYVLVTGLLFLVVMTLVALAMFRGTGLMDRISANSRDKQRSFESAQSALQYAEWWLSTHTPVAGTACNSLVSGDTVANIHVCSNALQSDFLTAQVWTGGFTYTPPNLQTGAGGMVSTGDTSDTNYQALPGFYLEYLGLSSLTGAAVYRITAYGSGGDASTRSIVRSTYQIGTTASSTGPGTGVGGL